MPSCDCGFDFARARLKKRGLKSYAVISERTYRAVIRKEHAIKAETNPRRKLALIGKAAFSVGQLMQCPDCGAWLLATPVHGNRGGYIVLRKTKLAANKMVQRTATGKHAN